jgi:hypothetical protein
MRIAAEQTMDAQRLDPSEQEISEERNERHH